MNLDRLKALVEHALNAGSEKLEFDEGGLRLTIQAITAPKSSTIHSSLFGLFHLQEGGASTPFVRLGQRIEAGQKIGLIEAMKVFSPVIADRSGRIVAVLAEHGAEVECGQPLFHVE